MSDKLVSEQWIQAMYSSWWYQIVTGFVDAECSHLSFTRLPTSCDVKHGSVLLLTSHSLLLCIAPEICHVIWTHVLTAVRVLNQRAAFRIAWSRPVTGSVLDMSWTWLVGSTALLAVLKAVTLLMKVRDTYKMHLACKLATLRLGWAAACQACTLLGRSYVKLTWRTIVCSSRW